jgi:hypothetical protein
MTQAEHLQTSTKQLERGQMLAGRFRSESPPHWAARPRSLASPLSGYTPATARRGQRPWTCPNRPPVRVSTFENVRESRCPRALPAAPHPTSLEPSRLLTIILSLTASLMRPSVIVPGLAPSYPTYRSCATHTSRLCVGNKRGGPPGLLPNRAACPRNRSRLRSVASGIQG